MKKLCFYILLSVVILNNIFSNIWKEYDHFLKHKKITKHIACTHPFKKITFDTFIWLPFTYFQRYFTFILFYEMQNFSPNVSIFFYKYNVVLSQKYRIIFLWLISKSSWFLSVSFLIAYFSYPFSYLGLCDTFY